MTAFEVVGGRVVNPSTTFTELTALKGSQFSVRTTPEGTKVTLQQIWSQNKTGGSARIRSSRMHDDVNGIRVRVPAANPRILLPYDVAEPLYNQDTLIPECTGGGSETDTVFWLNYYSQLPGSEGAFRSWAEVQPRIMKYMGTELTLTSGATAGDWGESKPINPSPDLFKRPYEYALLGYLVDKECGAVGFHGTDIGEVRCGGPGAVEPDLTGEWFIRLSEETKQAAIPTFQAANVPSILAEVAHTTAETAIHVTLLCAQLS